MGLLQYFKQQLGSHLPRHRRVAVDVVDNRVEVEPAPIDGKVAAPIVSYAFVANETPFLDRRDPVRTAAEGRREGRDGGILVRPVVRGQYGNVVGERREAQAGIRGVTRRTQQEQRGKNADCGARPGYPRTFGWG